MAIIQIPVKVLDEKCRTCRCLQIGSTELYSDNEMSLATEYYCDNLHMCTFIRNRIVRNEKTEGEYHNE